MHHDVIWGNGGIPPLILNLDIRQSQWWAYDLGRFTPEEPQVPLTRRLGGPQNWSEL